MMRNGNQQREARRENFRQMELDAANRALAGAGFNKRPDLQLATRIEFALYESSRKQNQAEVKLSLSELRITVARVTLLSALGLEESNETPLDDLIQAVVIQRNMARDAEAECRRLLNAEIVRTVELEQLLDASKLLATNRGLTIRTLERRIASNFQDESLAVRRKDEEIAELNSTLAQARAGYDSFVAVSIQQAERIKELEAQLASRGDEQLVDITVHGDVPLLVPPDGPSDVGA